MPSTPSSESAATLKQVVDNIPLYYAKFGGVTSNDLESDALRALAIQTEQLANDVEDFSNKAPEEQALLTANIQAYTPLLKMAKANCRADDDIGKKAVALKEATGKLRRAIGPMLSQRQWMPLLLLKKRLLTAWCPLWRASSPRKPKA